MNMLPSDRYLCSLLGITEDEFIKFKAIARQQLKDNPIEGPVAGTETAVTLAIINLVIGLGSIAVSLLLKPSIPKQRQPGEVKTTDISQEPIQSNTSFAPRYGFDSVQQVTKLGEVIPLVYAKRSVGGSKIGGVRVNMPLLWSQVLSFGTSQMLRAVFLAGEADIHSMDSDLWALGSNSLKNYKFNYNSQTQEAARTTIYFSGDGGRIIESDRVFGRSGLNDRRSNGGGSSSTASNGEVFLVERAGSERNDFCSAHKPTTNTTFGVYSLIGNDLVYKINPTIRPAVTIQTKPKTKDGQVQINCPIDEEQLSRREKMNIHYSCRSGIIAYHASSQAGLDSGTVGSINHSKTLSRGNYVRYKLFSGANTDSIGKRLRVKNAKKGRTYEITDLGNTHNDEWNALAGTSGVTYAVGQQITLAIDPQELLSLTELEALKEYRIQEKNPESKDNVVNPFGGRDYQTTDDEFDLIADPNNASYAIGKKFTVAANYSSLLSTIDVNSCVAGRRYEVVTVGSNMDEGWASNEEGDGGRWARLAGEFGSISAEDGDTRDQPIAVGDIITVTNFVSSMPADADGTVKGYFGPAEVRRVWGNGRVKPVLTAQDLADVSDAVASTQKTYDQNLIVGEVYKIGSAYGVCVGRTDGAFISAADELRDAGNTPLVNAVEADFYITEAGSCSIYPTSYLDATGDESTKRSTATKYDHILRVAQAVVTNTRPCVATEFGFRSVMGIRINNLCNFRDAKSFKFADESYCTAFRNEKAERLDSQFYQSSTITTSEQRYSFFTIQLKSVDAADSDNDWGDLGFVFGFAGETQQAQFNYLRLEFTAAKQRIFRFRPVSGFEIRQSSTSLYVIDAKSSRYTNGLQSTVNGETVKCEFNGYAITDTEKVSRFASRFSWNDFANFNDNSYDYVTKKLGDGDEDIEELFGLDEVDDPTTVGSNTYQNYIDSYAKLAESFPYQEVKSSAESVPEHEIVYVNEIVSNTEPAPTCADMALVGMNIRSSQEWNQFTQFSGYVKQGIQARQLRNSLAVGTVDLFPDVLLDLLTNETYGMGKYIKDEMIDLVAFEEAADFVTRRGTHGYRFNGIIAEQTNLRQYAADIAATNLLYFAEINGVFTLKPYFATNVSGNFIAVDIKALFTVGNILEDSYKVSYLTPEEREPIQVAVQYRQERASTDPNNEGVFAVVRSVLVKESAAAYEPFVTETLDMTDYCATREHAIDAAKFLIRMRRVPDHTITFKTTYEAVLSDISPGDYIKVALDATDYDEYNNGVVTSSGALVSTQTLADGSHTVYAWSPTSGNDPASTTLTVSNGGTTATPTGILFTEIVSNQASRTYQIERISADQDGTFTVEALHMPVNAGGIPEVVVDFDSASAWSLNDA